MIRYIRRGLFHSYSFFREAQVTNRDSTSTCPGLKCLVLQRAFLTLKIKYTFKRKALENCSSSWCSIYLTLENIFLLLQKHSVESHHHFSSCSLSLTQKPDTKRRTWWDNKWESFITAWAQGTSSCNWLEVCTSNLYIGLSLTSFRQKSPFRRTMDASVWIRYYVFTSRGWALSVHQRIQETNFG